MTDTQKIKPTKEKYGWHDQKGFDDLPSGWMLEGGEEAYDKALKEWQKLTKRL